jgi:Cd2+/Zn2+-exporting ATPase
MEGYPNASQTIMTNQKITSACCSTEHSEAALNACCGPVVQCDKSDGMSAAAVQVSGCCSSPPIETTASHQTLLASAAAGLVRYRIVNMDCPVEERLIRSKLGTMKGIAGLDFNLMSGTLTVHHQLEDIDAITVSLAAIGMQAEILEDDATSALPAQAGPHLANKQKALFGISGVAAVAAEVLAWTTHTDASPLVIGLAILSILTGGLPTLKKGWIALRNMNLNINFLMSLAVIGTVSIGQWPEAAMVVFLFAVAELIESLALDRARNAVQGLFKLAPDVASVRQSSGAWNDIAVNQVKVGDILQVKPGERIPLDGIVRAGASSINQAPITGESIPVDKHPGDQVFAGTINERGVMEVEATSDSRHSTLAKIVRIIEETQANRAPTQRFVDTFARYYTPAVVAMAVLIAIIPTLAFGADFSPWLYKALVMLVIACPCALVVSTPVTIVSGLTAATRMGLLIKGGQFLEMGCHIKAIAVDKTGTLTTGRPAVSSIIAFKSWQRVDVLLIASSLDANSSHPLASAIINAGPGTAERRVVKAFEALPGRGVRGEIDGACYWLGNRRLMEEQGIWSDAIAAQVQALEEKGQTVVLLADKDSVLGAIAIADQVRPEAAHAIKRLQDLGIAAVMLTGDNASSARSVGAQVGAHTVFSELLPEDKLAKIQELQATYGVVGMLGDGINDAPALAQANIGFAMGAAGSDTAIETADVALMNDDLAKLPAFIELSRATRRILVQNIAAALLIKIMFFALALGGIATLWMAVFADVGASLLVVFNGLRLLRHSSTHQLRVNSQERSASQPSLQS